MGSSTVLNPNMYSIISCLFLNEMNEQISGGITQRGMLFQRAFLETHKPKFMSVTHLKCSPDAVAPVKPGNGSPLHALMINWTLLSRTQKALCSFPASISSFISHHVLPLTLPSSITELASVHLFMLFSQPGMPFNSYLAKLTQSFKIQPSYQSLPEASSSAQVGLRVPVQCVMASFAYCYLSIS